MPGDFFPVADAQLNAWQQQFAAILTQNIGFWPLDGGLTAAFFDASSAWMSAYEQHVAAQARARAATQTKAAARDGLIAALRPLVKQIQSLTEVTNADRRNLGVTVVQDPARSVGPPTTAPAVQVAVAGRFTHLIEIRDPHAPTRRAKPKGTHGAEVWVAVSPTAHNPIPTDLAAYRFLQVATKPTLRTSFPMADAGRTAVYMLRWINAEGEAGPWSAPAPATVAA